MPEPEHNFKCLYSRPFFDVPSFIRARLASGSVNAIFVDIISVIDSLSPMGANFEFRNDPHGQQRSVWPQDQSYQAYCDETAISQNEGARVWALNAFLYGPIENMAALRKRLPTGPELKWQDQGFHSVRVPRYLEECFNAVAAGKLKLVVTFARAQDDAVSFSAHPAVLGKVVALEKIYTSVRQAAPEGSALNLVMDGKPMFPNIGTDLFLDFTPHNRPLIKDNPLTMDYTLAKCASLPNALDVVAGFMSYYFNRVHEKPLDEFGNKAKEGQFFKQQMVPRAIELLKSRFAFSGDGKDPEDVIRFFAEGMYDRPVYTQWQQIPPVRIVELKPD